MRRRAGALAAGQSLVCKNIHDISSLRQGQTRQNKDREWRKKVTKR